MKDTEIHNDLYHKEVRDLLSKTIRDTYLIDNFKLQHEI